MVKGNDVAELTYHLTRLAIRMIREFVDFEPLMYYYLNGEIISWTVIDTKSEESDLLIEKIVIENILNDYAVAKNDPKNKRIVFEVCENGVLYSKAFIYYSCSEDKPRFDFSEVIFD